ncbi:MAG: hypothetical protein HY602_03085 [Parcubacteria group bacterium]|nr:hypothetical protein [Parcubacteria group bacterium]
MREIRILADKESAWEEYFEFGIIEEDDYDDEEENLWIWEEEDFLPWCDDIQIYNIFE